MSTQPICQVFPLGAKCCESDIGRAASPLGYRGTLLPQIRVAVKSILRWQVARRYSALFSAPSLTLQPASKLLDQGQLFELRVSQARSMTANCVKLMSIVSTIVSIVKRSSKARYCFFRSLRSFRVDIGAFFATNEPFGGVHIPNRSCIEVIVSAKTSFRMRLKIDASIRLLATLANNNHQRGGDLKFERE